MQQRNLTQRGIVGIALVLFLGGGFASGVNHWLTQYDYVARVNQVPIRNVRLQRELIQMQQYLNKPLEELPWLEKSLVQQLVDRELQLQAAAEQGIRVNPQQVKNEWERILASQYANDQERMNRALVGGRFTPTSFREELKKRNILEQFHAQLNADTQLTPEDYEKYYLKNQENYRVDERIEVRHILLHITDERPEAQTKQLAQELLTRLKAGEDFAALAKEYSDDPSTKAQGGKLEPFKKGDMETAFEEAAWKLKPGQLAPQPVKTDYGYHIILRGKTLPKGLKPLEEVKSSFADRLLQEKKQAKIQSWLETARQEAEIKLHPRFEDSALSTPAAENQPPDAQSQRSQSTEAGQASSPPQSPQDGPKQPTTN